MKPIATASMLFVLSSPSYSLPEVGIGATSCQKFALDYNRDPRVEEQYFVWAQGYMSAIAMMAADGIDDNLSFLSPSHPKDSQMAVLRSVCYARPSSSYAEAVRVLYRHLGGKALK
jgi:hypothetical protein